VTRTDSAADEPVGASVMAANVTATAIQRPALLAFTSRP
jgi:hypothetical protein